MPGKGLTREQKTGFVLLLIFGILAVGLGLLQMRNTIYGPFVIRAQEPSSQIVLDENARLQRIDTDQDGINDYEELNFYETSPYIPDTDSDGTGDKQEIDRGTDPLCPEGEVCVSADSGVTTTSTIGTPVQSDTSASGDIAASEGTLNPADLEALINDPAGLRELLRASGKMTEEELAAIDDATLQQLAQEVIEESANQQDATVSAQ